MRHSATDTGATGDQPTAVVLTLPTASAAPTGDPADPRGGDPVEAVDAVDTLAVHLQLRPRRSAGRKCLAALAALADAHPGVPVTLAGLSKDARVLRITLAVDLGPRAEVARFSAAAQAAYLFVADVFTVLYDHMPVYATEPTAEESAAVATVFGEDTGSRAVWSLDADPALDAVSA